jgi:hypothetical protein
VCSREDLVTGFEEDDNEVWVKIFLC